MSMRDEDQAQPDTAPSKLDRQRSKARVLADDIGYLMTRIEQGSLATLAEYTSVQEEIHELQHILADWDSYVSLTIAKLTMQWDVKSKVSESRDKERIRVLEQYRIMMSNTPSSPFVGTCLRAQLLMPLLLGTKAVGATWYVHLFLASCVCSRLSATCLATCPYRVWYTVTRLGPPGFSPEPSRPWSTCESRDIHECHKTILAQLPKNGKENLCNGCSQMLSFGSVSRNRLPHALQSYMDFMLKPTIAGDEYTAISGYANVLHARTRKLLGEEYA